MARLLFLCSCCIATLAQVVPVAATQENNNGVIWWYYDANSISIQSQPNSADFSGFAPPVGNQDPNNIGLNSCSAWVAAEDRYWLAYADYANQYSPGFAPMYTYTRLNGHSAGTTTNITDNYYYMVHDGAYTMNEYPSLSGNGGGWDAKYDYWQSAATATNHKLYSYGQISNDNGGKFVSEMKELVDYGYPVDIVIPHYNDIASVSGPNYLVNSSVGTGLAHAVFASKYDSNGVWFQNTYGTAYGKSGWAELSWSYVSNYVPDLYWAWDATGDNLFKSEGQTGGSIAVQPTTGGVSIPPEPVLGGRGISDDGVTSARASGSPGDPRFGGRDLAPSQYTAENTFVVGSLKRPKRLDGVDINVSIQSDG